MKGFAGYQEDDYADADLRALREQEDHLRRKQRADQMQRQCEAEKEQRRKNIKELGAIPCA